MRNLASIFTRRTGIPMEGTEVYTRTVPADQKRNGTLKLGIYEKTSFCEAHNFIHDTLLFILYIK